MANKGIQRVTPGYATWRWLSSIAVKQSQWLLGSLSGRGGYEAWMSHLVQGFEDTEFIASLETTSDPWMRSKIVGEKISQLAKEYARLSREQKAELAKSAEVELKTGLDILTNEKKRVFELLKAVTAPLDDPPANR
jgi:hypothetical protein